MLVQVQFTAAAINRLDESFFRVSAQVYNVGRIAMKKLGMKLYEATGEQVPKGTNTLYNSRFIDLLDVDGKTIGVVVGYGGRNDQINPKTGQYASEYMVPVHERVEASHPNGKAKFLEDPAHDIAQSMEKILGAELKGAL